MSDPVPVFFDVDGLGAVEIFDYEAPPDTPLLYRARGVIVVGGGIIAGDWSATAGPVAWTIVHDETECDGVVAWLKDPLEPFNNRIVILGEGALMAKTRRIVRGVFAVLGRSRPVAVTDVRGSMETDLNIITKTPEEAADVVALFDVARTLLVQCPGIYGWLSEYVSPGDLVERHAINQIHQPERVFTCPVVVVDAPVSG